MIALQQEILKYFINKIYSLKTNSRDSFVGWSWWGFNNITENNEVFDELLATISNHQHSFGEAIKYPR